MFVKNLNNIDMFQDLFIPKIFTKAALEYN